MTPAVPGKDDPDYPFAFRMARTLYALLRGYRGEYRLYSLLGKLGQLNRAGRFTYFDGHIYVPLQVPEALFVDDFSLFYGLREVNFAHQINSMFEDFVLLDCGAYYGKVTMRIARLCPGMERVILFEPNPNNCAYAQANLALTNKPHRIINAAVSDFSGRASLHFPEGRNVPDSAYIEKDDNGEIEVLRLDDLPETQGLDLRGKNLALKIDVEGQELATVMGGEELIRSAAGVCYFLELHPGVLKRMNQTACELLRTVTEVRPTEWYVADYPEIRLSLDKPIFEQMGGERVCDVIGVAV